MRESGYYPAGAEHDPSAPWNQSEPTGSHTYEVEVFIDFQTASEFINIVEDLEQACDLDLSTAKPGLYDHHAYGYSVSYLLEATAYDCLGEDPDHAERMEAEAEHLSECSKYIWKKYNDQVLMDTPPGMPF